MILTLKTTRSCSPSCRTVPSSFIRRTNAMAKFFSLLSLAGDKEDKRVNKICRGEGCGRNTSGEKKGRREVEDSGIGEGKTADLFNQVCVMMLWVIFQIASNHSVLSVSHYAQGIRQEELRRVDVCRQQTGRGREADTHTPGRSGV